jgi:hypothetical protein
LNSSEGGDGQPQDAIYFRISGEVIKKMLRSKLTRLSVSGLLALSALIGTLSMTSSEALAFDCGTGWVNARQQDNTYNPQSGYYWHGWLGECEAPGIAYYYGGEDSRWSWGGTYHNVSGMSIRLRAWSCGSLYYDNTASNANQAYIQLVTPWNWECLVQADLSGHEWVGSTSWYYYLHF